MTTSEYIQSFIIRVMVYTDEYVITIQDVQTLAVLEFSSWEECFSAIRKTYGSHTEKFAPQTEAKSLST